MMIDPGYHLTSTEPSDEGTHTTHLAAIVAGKVVTVTVCEWAAVPAAGLPATHKFTADNCEVHDTMHDLIVELETRGHLNLDGD